MVLRGDLRETMPRIVFVNDAFTRLTGYSADDLDGHTADTLWGPHSDRATLRQAIRELRAGRAFDGRIVAYRKDGSPFIADGYVEPICRGLGAEPELLVVARNVTEQNPRDAAVRHIVAALDHVEEGVVVLSADREVQYLNRAGYDLFDRGGDVHVPLPRNAWKQLDQGLAWTGEAVVAMPTGDRLLELEVQPVHGFDGEPSRLVVARDVTDVKRLRSIADSVNLSDNLGHFLSGIRHELGNPVNSIKTALTVLHSNLGAFGVDKTRDYLKLVLGEISRIEFLLSSLRSFSRHESVILDRVEVSALVKEVLALVRTSVRNSHVELVVEPPPAVSVIADQRAVYQVLLNLISNAMEAPRGDVDLVIRIETTVRTDYVDIAVVDNACGMTGTDLEMAMRPFHTTKRTGTGLGLVIASRLATNQGGRLRLLSTPGEGTRAVLSLPRAPEWGAPS